MCFFGVPTFWMCQAKGSFCFLISRIFVLNSNSANGYSGISNNAKKVWWPGGRRLMTNGRITNQTDKYGQYFSMKLEKQEIQTVPNLVGAKKTNLSNMQKVIHWTEKNEAKKGIWHQIHSISNRKNPAESLISYIDIKLHAKENEFTTFRLRHR